MGSKERFYADIMALHEEVTGSCFLVSVKLPDGDNKRFVVDCGLFQEKRYSETNNEKAHRDLNKDFPFKAENVEFCLVTHNHVDHTGRLPLLVKEGFEGKIYATEDTCKLLPLALYDSQKVLRDKAKTLGEKCIYTELDVYNALKLTSPCKFKQAINIDDNFKVTFFRNGHLVGAACILVQISYPGYDDINLFFTGDYHRSNMFFEVTSLPKWVTELPLTIMQEATYGNFDSRQIQKCFKQNIKESIEREETALVLVFSLGRAQEILYEIKKMQDEGILKDVPIYFDGKLAQKYTRLYLNGDLNIKEEMKNFLPNNLIEVTEDNRPDVLADTQSKVIVTTSGMGTYGPASTYIPEYIIREKALIHLSGYATECSLARRILEIPKGEKVKINGVFLTKKADVKTTSEYSKHTKADESIEFLKSFTNLKLVVINHGEFNVKEIFDSRVCEEVKPKQTAIIGRTRVIRVNPYGMVKTIPSKFK